MQADLTPESRMKLHDIRNHMQLFAGKRALKQAMRKRLDGLFEKAVTLVQRGVENGQVEARIREIHDVFRRYAEQDQAMEAAYDRIVAIILDRDEAAEKLVDLGALVREEVRYCRNDLRALSAERLLFQEAHPAFVRGRPIRLTRMVQNLIYNAVEAVRDEGGEVSVSVDLHGVGQTLDGILGPIEPGAYAAILVEDDGEGFPLEEVEAAFAVGYSTKGAKHPGLGLAVIARVLREHGGNLQILRPGPGTLVRAYLPAVDPEEEGEAADGRELPRPD